MVKGSVFFELFHVCFQTKIIIKFEGAEIIPKRLHKKIFDM
jgi:hypothetical protein